MKGHKMNGAEKRKANAIARIMEDRQVTMDEAIEIYKERFKLLGSRGGKTTGKSKVRGDSEYYSRISGRRK